MTATPEESRAGRPEDPYASLARLLAIVEPLQNLLLGPARREAVRLLRGHGCRRVLDVSCGAGVWVQQASAAGLDAMGVDASATMLARARKRRRGHFEQRDATTLPYAGEFDGATIALALHEMAPAVREAVWGRMQAAVRPGGLLVALDFDPPGPGWLARRVGRFIEGDERGMGRIDPAHYAHYRDFLAGGGLSGWLRAQGAQVIGGRRHWRGNLLLAAVRNGG